MSLPKEKIYTTEDIYALPDGERAELIDGQIYDKYSPSRMHQMILGELFTIIQNYIKSKGGSCEPYIAPFAVFLNGDDRNYVEPDISVICDRSKLTDKGCFGAPDWIVDPDKKRITVYDIEHEDVQDYTFDDLVKVNIYPDLSIDFGKLSF